MTNRRRTGGDFDGQVKLSVRERKLLGSFSQFCFMPCARFKQKPKTKSHYPKPMKTFQLGALLVIAAAASTANSAKADLELSLQYQGSTIGPIDIGTIDGLAGLYGTYFGGTPITVDLVTGATTDPNNPSGINLDVALPNLTAELQQNLVDRNYGNPGDDGAPTFQTLSGLTFDVTGSGDGLTFTSSTAPATDSTDLSDNNGTVYGTFSINHTSGDLQFTTPATVTAPEPSTWAMMVAGLLALVGIVRHRARATRI
jgi:hypothetical protein